MANSVFVLFYSSTWWNGQLFVCTVHSCLFQVEWWVFLVLNSQNFINGFPGNKWSISDDDAIVRLGEFHASPHFMTLHLEKVWHIYFPFLLVCTCPFHRINQAGEDIWAHQVQPMTQQHHANQTMALIAKSSLPLNTSSDGDFTTSLGSSFQCLVTFSMKKFLLMSKIPTNFQFPCSMLSSVGSTGLCILGKSLASLRPAASFCLWGIQDPRKYILNSVKEWLYKVLMTSTDHLKPDFKAAFQKAIFHVGLMCL